MFNDEGPFAFKKMHEFSTVDGFMEITESLADMIKYLANEPSVGLFYVQQHTQNAVPNLINLKNNVAEKSREITLHAEDLEDSVTMVRSMKECGSPIAEDMIRDITKSLAIMSTKQPKRGLIHNSSSEFRMGRTSSWSPATWGRTAVHMEKDGEGSGGYFSTVLKSAKQRASNFKWPQLDSRESRKAKDEKLPFYPNPSPIATSTLQETDAGELPVSSQPGVDELEEELPVDESLSSEGLIPLSENYDEFRADREAKLEEWLGGAGDQDGRSIGVTNAVGI